jgi:hypothetical protein
VSWRSSSPRSRASLQLRHTTATRHCRVAAHAPCVAMAARRECGRHHDNAGPLFAPSSPRRRRRRGQVGESDARAAAAGAGTHRDCRGRRRSKGRLLKIVFPQNAKFFKIIPIKNNHHHRPDMKQNKFYNTGSIFYSNSVSFSSFRFLFQNRKHLSTFIFYFCCCWRTSSFATKICQII